MQYLLDTNICVFFLRGKMNLDEIINVNLETIKIGLNEYKPKKSWKPLKGWKLWYL